MSKKSKASSAKKSNIKKAVKKKASKKAVKPAKKAPAKKVKPKAKPASNKKAAPKKAVKAKKIVTKKSTQPKSKEILKKVVAKKLEKVKKAEVKQKAKPVKVIETKKPLKEIPQKLIKKETAINQGIQREPAKEVKKTEDKIQSNEVLAISNTIPKTEVVPLSASKIASISSSITNPLKQNDSYAVKAEKEPAGKFEMEFVVRSSPEMLYEFLSTPSGLSEWFCDDVNIRNGIYTFIWDGQLQQARLLKTLENQIVRFQWVEKTDGSYFEFKIQRDDLTNDISLIITDFGDSVSERESSKRLWQSQVEKLLHIMGSIH